MWSVAGSGLFGETMHHWNWASGHGKESRINSKWWNKSSYCNSIERALNVMEVEVSASGRMPAERGILPRQESPDMYIGLALFS